jgi:hypothetical protein
MGAMVLDERDSPAMNSKKPFDFAWVIVGVSFMTLGLTYGVMYCFSVFFVALLKEFHWSRSLGAGAYSFCLILHHLIGPLVGKMVNRFGPRRVILLGCLALCMGLALSSLIQTWWQFYLSFGVLTAMGFAELGGSPIRRLSIIGSERRGGCPWASSPRELGLEYCCVFHWLNLSLTALGGVSPTESWPQSSPELSLSWLSYSFEKHLNVLPPDWLNKKSNLLNLKFIVAESRIDFWAMDNPTSHAYETVLDTLFCILAGKSMYSHPICPPGRVLC